MSENVQGDWGALLEATLEDGPEPVTVPFETPAGDTSGQLGPYRVLEMLGRGGMGEVFRVWDPDLHRPIALKVVLPEVTRRSDDHTRFLQEARITAMLQHPGVIPVYSLGILPDSRPYYTMEEVRGRMLKDVIREVHFNPAQPPEAAHESEAQPTGSSWTFRRLIEVFHSVCETIAYAHSQGIVHRDLKPANIMVGSFGTVHVLDWGLAHRAADRDDREDDGGEEAPGSASPSGRQGDAAALTRVGVIKGTPAYMSPEQARGETGRLFPQTDVYALGAILYEILAGRPPYEGNDAWEVLGQVRAGSPPPPRRRRSITTSSETLTLTTLPIGAGYVPFAVDAPADMAEQTLGDPVSEELEAICRRAMARDPSERYPDAGPVALEVKQWLDGARRREQALAIVSEAEPLLPEAASLRERVARLRKQCLEQKADMTDAPIEVRRSLWALEDEAEQLEHEAHLKEALYARQLHAALMHQADLPEACDRLADFYQEQHSRAESQGDDRLAARSDALLRMYDRGRYAAYLKGDGAVTLLTEPAGAEVHLFRYELEDRRLVPRFVRSLGRTPVVRQSLPMGSYLLILKSPAGGPDVRYPVFIGRQQHWDGVPPGGSEPGRIQLPGPHDLGPDDIYVPTGWFQCGYEGIGEGSLPRGWRWVDGFVARRFPVTNREYLAFLNDLLEQGREEDALRHAPREVSGTASEKGAVVYGRAEDGRFVLRTDAWGTLWLEDWPVHMIDWYDANAYARWEAARSRRSWRMLKELEWEKAARGVDARVCPWGNYPEASWLRGDRRGAKAHVAVVDSYPYDESPYGVRGMGGNVRDWCEDVREFPRRTVQEPGVSAEASQEGEVPHRVVRGGSWQSTAVHLGLVARFTADPITRYYEIGFRLARPL